MPKPVSKSFTPFEGDIFVNSERGVLNKFWKISDSNLKGLRKI